MKQLSLILNIVLVLALAFLYYHVFSEKKQTSSKQAVVSSTSTMPVNFANRPPIAYVDLDSLNEKIFYIKERRKELETEQKGIENEWNNNMRNLENQKNNFLKKGNAITQQEAEQFQAQLYQQQQQVEAKKQSTLQKLSEKSYKFMDDIQKKLKEFLADYNKDKNYMYILTTGTGLDYMVYKDSALNITADVVSGMNEKMGNKK
ncbi:MAG: OmpH family outer membrane protein [Ferruginibacter sp.]